MITLMSFGFKYGAPHANYFFDVGFFKNPARDAKWTFFSYPDEEMRQFMLKQPEFSRFCDLVTPLAEYLARIDQNQILAFGCSAGRHRSPLVVEELANRLRGRGIGVRVIHRERAMSDL